MEHSAILLTCIKRYLVLKTVFGLFERDFIVLQTWSVQDIRFIWICWDLCWNPDQTAPPGVSRLGLHGLVRTEIIKLYSCSTQLSMIFQLLIKPKMLKNKHFSCFKTLRGFIYHAYKC